MSWIFKPGVPPNESLIFNGQIVYPSTDLEISDTCIQYITGCTFVSTTQLEIKNTGFSSKAYLLGTVKINTLQISISSGSKTLVESVRSLVRGVNNSGLWVKFNDIFVTGTILNPILYYCRLKSFFDFSDNNILQSSCTLNFYASDPNPTIEALLEFQKVIDIPISTLQWDLQIENTSVLHEYARQV